MVTLGRGAPMSAKDIATSVEAGLLPIAGILLIVAAGGGRRAAGSSRRSSTRGIGKLIADRVAGSGLSVI